jgi:hypothetical protein
MGPGGEVIVPTITWVSDIAAVLHCGFEPVFVDIDPRTLGMDNAQVLAKTHSAYPGRVSHPRTRIQRALAAAPGRPLNPWRTTHGGCLRIPRGDV